MTYEDYVKYQIFEEKRIHFNHKVNGSHMERTRKKRFGKLIKFYTLRATELCKQYECLEPMYAINYYTLYINSKFVNKVFELGSSGYS